VLNYADRFLLIRYLVGADRGGEEKGGREADEKAIKEEAEVGRGRNRL
jgi:hypothetical protein